MKWLAHPLCAQRIACRDCRTDAEFRASLLTAGKVDVQDFACPFQFTAENFPAPPETKPEPGRFRVKMKKAGCGKCPPIEVVFRAA